MMISAVMAGRDPAIYRRTVQAVMAGSEPGHDVEALCQTAVFTLMAPGRNMTVPKS